MGVEILPAQPPPHLYGPVEANLLRVRSTGHSLSIQGVGR